MKLIDYAKAVVVAVAAMAVLLATSFPAVGFYRYLIAPGHPGAYYAAAAQWLVPLWIHCAGPMLFLVLGYGLARRRSGASPWGFIAAVCGAYLILEIASLAALGALAAFFKSTDGLWLAAQMAAAGLGTSAGLTVRNRPTGDL